LVVAKIIGSAPTRRVTYQARGREGLHFWQML